MCVCVNFHLIKVWFKQSFIGWHSTGDHCRCSYIVYCCYSSDTESAHEKAPCSFKTTSSWVFKFMKLGCFSSRIMIFHFACNFFYSTFWFRPVKLGRLTLVQAQPSLDWLWMATSFREENFQWKISSNLVACWLESTLRWTIISQLLCSQCHLLIRRNIYKYTIKHSDNIHNFINYYKTNEHSIFHF